MSIEFLQDDESGEEQNNSLETTPPLTETSLKEEPTTPLIDETTQPAAANTEKAGEATSEEKNPKQNKPEKFTTLPNDALNSLTRVTKTLNWNGEDGQQIMKVVNARIEAGLAETFQQAIDQMIDFAINSKAANAFLKEGQQFSFAVPDDYEPKLLKKGFYKKYSQVKIPLCK